MRVAISLITSVTLHLVLLLLLLVWGKLANYLDIPELISPHAVQRPSHEEVSVVLLEESPESEESTKGKAEFLAAKNQRVREQTQARFKGLTQNKLFPTRPTFKSPPSPKAQKEAATDASGKVSISATERLNRALSAGISTVSESLPEKVKYGDFTSLNTDQYMFYSFFSRIAPRIRFQWETGVESAVEDLTMRSFNLRDAKTFSTEVEVRLDPKGYLQKVFVYRSSGVPGLDQAVVEAFERTTPFINPPAEMVKSDGLIHLYYVFRVHLHPQMFAQPN